MSLFKLTNPVEQGLKALAAECGMSTLAMKRLISTQMSNNALAEDINNAIANMGYEAPDDKTLVAMVEWINDHNETSYSKDTLMNMVIDAFKFKDDLVPAEEEEEE